MNKLCNFSQILFGIFLSTLKGEAEEVLFEYVPYEPRICSSGDIILNGPNLHFQSLPHSLLEMKNGLHFHGFSHQMGEDEHRSSLPQKTIRQASHLEAKTCPRGPLNDSPFATIHHVMTRATNNAGSSFDNNIPRGDENLQNQNRGIHIKDGDVSIPLLVTGRPRAIRPQDTNFPQYWDDPPSSSTVFDSQQKIMLNQSSSNSSFSVKSNNTQLPFPFGNATRKDSLQNVHQNQSVGDSNSAHPTHRTKPTNQDILVRHYDRNHISGLLDSIEKRVLAKLLHSPHASFRIAELPIQPIPPKPLKIPIVPSHPTLSKPLKIKITPSNSRKLPSPPHPMKPPQPPPPLPPPSPPHLKKPLPAFSRDFNLIFDDCSSTEEDSDYY